MIFSNDYFMAHSLSYCSSHHTTWLIYYCCGSYIDNRYMYNGDRILENMQGSYFWFWTFGGPQLPLGMACRFETFRSHARIVVLRFLQVSLLSVIPAKCYESSKLKNWMCELCMFPKSGHNYSRTSVIWISIIRTLSYLNAILNFIIPKDDLIFLQNQVINEIPVWFLDSLGLLYHSISE